MKRPLPLLLAFCLLPLIACTQPKLEILEGLKFDLGKIGRGTVATKRLTLKNTGHMLLELGNVEVSCGCTGTVVSNKKLLPGDTTSLLITFNSRNSSGPVHKSVTINSNAEGMPKTVVEFTATVTEDVSVNPVQFYFKDAEVGRTSYATIKLKNEGEKPLKITGYRTQLQGFTLRYDSDLLAPGESRDITAEFTPKKASGVLSDAVNITTSSTAQPEVYVYILGAVKEFKFEPVTPDPEAH